MDSLSEMCVDIVPFSFFRFVIYFSTLCHDANQGQKLLNAAMDSLLTLPESAHPESSTTVHSENSAEEKPTVLWKALYIQ